MDTRFLGIDVGGSSIKMALVQAAGTAVQMLPTLVMPQPSTPSAVLDLIALHRSSQAIAAAGLAFPTVVKQGRARTTAHVDPAWQGVDGAAELRLRLHCPVTFLNDADAAGIAEMRVGAGRDLKGVIIMLTFGTGIGTALFVDGRLVPNTELGHLLMRGGDSEDWASARARTRDQLDFPAWAARVNEYLDLLQRLFWPDAFIVGGGVSDHFDQFGPLLKSPADIVPAHFRSQAGVIGAALAAADAIELT